MDSTEVFNIFINNVKNYIFIIMFKLYITLDLPSIICNCNNLNRKITNMVI